MKPISWFTAPTIFQLRGLENNGLDKRWTMRVPWSWGQAVPRPMRNMPSVGLSPEEGRWGPSGDRAEVRVMAGAGDSDAGVPEGRGL